MSPAEVLDHYEATRQEVMDAAKEAADEERLTSRDAVMAPLAFVEPTPAPHVGRPDDDRVRAWGGRLPEDGPPMTLAQAVNATLADLMTAHAEVLVFGEDVAVKGGVYGVTRGLRKRFGGRRVFDTLLDEQTILGTALGTALAGFVPIPEIQYLAYLHNAEDQLRGEAATLRFFSNGQFHNGMVVRVAGLAYQRGFGGHFHNDNSVAVLRDVPGLVLAVPSHPAEAPGLLRTCFDLAQQDGRVCVFLEPIARYHTRDLLDGDGEWTASYTPPQDARSHTPLGEVGRYGDGRDVLLVTFGNGVHLSRRAAATLSAGGVASTVLDLRWLAPLPVEALASAAREFRAVLVVDETRHSGGVSEGVVAALVDAGYEGRLSRVNSADSFIPLGPAAETVLLGEDDIVQAVRDLLGTTPTHQPGPNHRRQETRMTSMTPSMPAHDLAGIDHMLTQEELDVRQAVRAFVSAEVQPHVAGWFEEGAIDDVRGLAKKLGGLGLLGMHLDGYGCAGMSATQYGLACLELEACDSGLRSFVSVQGSLAMFAIWRYGSEEQKNEWLPRMAGGEAIGCFGLTEPDHGSDPGGHAHARPQRRHGLGPGRAQDVDHQRLGRRRGRRVGADRRRHPRLRGAHGHAGLLGARDQAQDVAARLGDQRARPRRRPAARRRGAARGRPGSRGR